MRFKINRGHYTKKDVALINKHILRHRVDESNLYSFEYSYDNIFLFTDKAAYCFNYTESRMLSDYDKMWGHYEMTAYKDTYKLPCQCVKGRLSFEKIKKIRRIDSKIYPSIKPFQIDTFSSKGNEMWDTFHNNSKKIYKTRVNQYSQNWNQFLENKYYIIPYTNSYQGDAIEEYFDYINK